MTKEETIKRYDELNIAMKQIIDGKYDINLDKTNPSIIDIKNPSKDKSVIIAKDETYKVDKDFYNSITYKLNSSNIVQDPNRLLFLAVNETINDVSASKTYRMCFPNEFNVLNIDIICSYKCTENNIADIMVITDKLEYDEFYKLMELPLNFHVSDIRLASYAIFFEQDILELCESSFYSDNAMLEILKRHDIDKSDVSVIHVYKNSLMKYTKNDIRLISLLQDLSIKLYDERSNIDDFILKRHL